jgi:hypothetical protein
MTSSRQATTETMSLRCTANFDSLNRESSPGHQPGSESGTRYALQSRPVLLSLGAKPTPSTTACQDDVYVRLSHQGFDLMIMPRVLSYPPGPGAIKITNGDLKRLNPRAFLNDSLVQLGLE